MKYKKITKVSRNSQKIRMIQLEMRMITKYLKKYLKKDIYVYIYIYIYINIYIYIQKKDRLLIILVFMQYYNNRI